MAPVLVRPGQDDEASNRSRHRMAVSQPLSATATIRGQSGYYNTASDTHLNQIRTG